MERTHYVRELNGPFSDHMSRGDNWAGPLFGLVFLVLLALVTVYVVRALTRNQAATQTREPLDIAKERYAKGEITKEELSEIKKELK